MKKFLSIALTMIMVISLVGCGNNATVEESTQPTTQATEPTTESPIQIQTGEFNRMGSIVETVLCDNENAKIVANDLIYNTDYAKLELTIENKTTQKLSFCAGRGESTLSINGYYFDDFNNIYCTISAGCVAKETLNIYYDDLAFVGINEIADITIEFYAQDDDYNTVFTVAPVKINTTLADSYDYTKDYFAEALKSNNYKNIFGYQVDSSANGLIYDKSGIKIENYAFVTTNDGDKLIMLEIKNTNSEPVIVAIGDICINGISLCSYRYDSVYVGANNKSVTTIIGKYLADTGDLADYGITDISNISMSVTSYKTNDSLISDDTEITLNNTNATATQTDMVNGTEIYNSNGIRILSNGLKQEDYYSEDIHAMFFVENNSGKEIYIDVEYDSLAINGYMADFICYSKTIANGKSGVLDVELWSYTLDELEIATTDDINNIKFTCEIRDSYYSEIDTPTITLNY